MYKNFKKNGLKNKNPANGRVLNIIKNKNVIINYISKSGTTTEPAVAFRLLKNHIENKYGVEEAASRIIAITDKSRGALKSLATRQGYKTYVIPDDIGGRYSVLTPVGLLPIAVAGYDIRQLVQGAAEMRKACLASDSLGENPRNMGHAARDAGERRGKGGTPI